MSGILGERSKQHTVPTDPSFELSTVYNSDGKSVCFCVNHEMVMAFVKVGQYDCKFL